MTLEQERDELLNENNTLRGILAKIMPRHYAILTARKEI